MTEHRFKKRSDKMREILFRGFYPNERGEQRAFVNGKWTKGYWVTGNLFLPDNPKTPTQICIGTSTVRISYDVIPETVGQYTGLQDKNGKKIFEGDIVKCVSRYDVANCVVIFEEGEFRLIPEKYYKTYITGNGFCFLRCFEKEAIGNIFENLELLKGGEE